MKVLLLLCSWPLAVAPLKLSLSTRRKTSSLRRLAVAPTAEAPRPPNVVSTKPRVIFCLGGPGAGKGTQCERLERDYGFAHLSAGELLRTERNSGSADGDLIESYLSQGKIVPVALSLGLLRREMESRNTTRFVIDGFPRNQDNVDGWNELMTGECRLVTAIIVSPTQAWPTSTVCYSTTCPSRSSCAA